MSSALSAADVTAIFSKGLPAPTFPYSATLLSANQVLLRQNGKYYAFSSTLSNQTVSAKSVTSMLINSLWTVGFPAERMPPKRGGILITLKFLQSPKDHSDFDVAHFSGTATYTTSFTLSPIDKCRQHAIFKILVELKILPASRSTLRTLASLSCHLMRLILLRQSSGVRINYK